MPSEQYREPLSRGSVREGNDDFPDMATSHEMVKCLPCPSKGKHTVDHRPQAGRGPCARKVFQHRSVTHRGRYIERAQISAKARNPRTRRSDGSRMTAVRRG